MQINFRDHDLRGIRLGRQATKTDLVDIALALGVSFARDEMTVDTLRLAIRWRLQQLHARKVLPADHVPLAPGVKLLEPARG